MRTIGEREPDVPRASRGRVKLLEGKQAKVLPKYLPMFQYLLHKAEARYAERF